MTNSMDVRPRRRTTWDVSKHPEYEAINASLLDHIPIERDDVLRPKRILDLGAGNGSVSRLALARWPAAEIWAVDPAADLLEALRRDLGAAVTAVIGSAEELSSVVTTDFDLVVMANCVHLFTDRVEVFEQASSVLSPGGVLAFNSAFFSDAIPPDDRPKYWNLMVKTVRRLRRDGVAEIRVKTTRRRANPLDRALLECELAEAGLRLSGVETVAVDLAPDLVVAILSEEMFAEPLFEGVDATLLSRALISTAEEMLEHGIRVRRNWHSVYARKGVQ